MFCRGLSSAASSRVPLRPCRDDCGGSMATADLAANAVGSEKSYAAAVDYACSIVEDFFGETPKVHQMQAACGVVALSTL